MCGRPLGKIGWGVVGPVGGKVADLERGVTWGAWEG